MTSQPLRFLLYLCPNIPDIFSREEMNSSRSNIWPKKYSFFKKSNFTMTWASAEIAISNFFLLTGPLFHHAKFYEALFYLLVGFQNPDKFCLLNNVWFFLCKIWVMTVPNQLFLLMYNNRLCWNQYLNTCPIHSSFHPGISISNFWGSQPPFSKLIHTHSLAHSPTHSHTCMSVHIVYRWVQPFLSAQPPHPLRSPRSRSSARAVLTLE